MNDKNSDKTAVYEGYQAWSATYDAQPNATRAVSEAVIKHLVLSVEGQIIVEAGCGTGSNTGWLADRAEHVIAFDFSDGMLARARYKVRAPNVQFHKHDLTQPWPVVTNTADLVLINLVIEHIADLESVLRESHRVLKQNGRLLITEYHPDRVQKGNGAQIERDGQAAIEIINFWHPIDEYEKLGAKLGFETVEVHEWAEQLDAQGQPVQSDRAPQLISVLMQK